MNIIEAIKSLKCRKGEPDGVAKGGAYWMPMDCITTRKDGDITATLEMKHFREDKVTCSIAIHEYEGGKTRTTCQPIDLSNIETVEDLIVALKKIKLRNQHVISSEGEERLTKELTRIGATERAPSPDDVAA